MLNKKELTKKLPIIINLIKLTLPHKINDINPNITLNEIVEITKAWLLENTSRLEVSIEDKYSKYQAEIIKVMKELGLRQIMCQIIKTTIVL